MSWFLKIRAEDGQTRRLPIEADSLVIGRSITADVQLDLPTVSRAHARLERQANGHWTISDMQSRGGTRVNGDNVDRAVVTAGDVIEISRYQLQLIDGDSTTLAGDEREATWSQAFDEADISVLSTTRPPRVQASHLSALNALGRTLLETENDVARRQALCDAIAGEVVQGEWALVLEMDFDAPTRPPHILCASPSRLLDQRDIHISRSTIAAMCENGAAVMASNRADDRGHIELTVVSGEPATVVVAVPLDRGDAAVGSLLYANLPPAMGTTEWLAVIALAAKEYQQAETTWRDRAAAQARAVIERDLDNARKIQRSILPKRLDLQGLDAAWRCEPCETTGGDLLDVINMPDGKILLTIADVSGHGLPASLATLSVHSVTRTCIKSGMTAERMMTMLNEHLCEHFPVGRFVTMLTLTIDPDTGRTQCIAAGHHAPAVVSPDGALRELGAAEHMVLGVEPIDFTAADDCVNANDLLLLSTDGLTELPIAGGRMLGIPGVNQLFRDIVRRQPNNVEAAAELLWDDLDRLRGDAPMLDDQTFLLARRR